MACNVPAGATGARTRSPDSIAAMRRRSCLSVPGSSERMLAKAPGLGADEVVLDLEDAVATGEKDRARALVAAALEAQDWGAVAVAVRVNAPRTPWCHEDLAALAAAPGALASVVVPKVEGAGDLAFVERLLDGVEGASGGRRALRVQALIETAAGLARIDEIATASVRLDALILGYADLAASLGRLAAGAGDLDGWRAAQHQVLVAARAYGLQAIDGPHLGVAADDAFLAGATRARDAGFDGKWAIHPGQVAALNDLFTPSAAEVDRARAVVAALDAAAHGDGLGAVALDGQMVDEALRAAALRTLARAGGSAGG